MSDYKKLKQLAEDGKITNEDSDELFNELQKSKQEALDEANKAIEESVSKINAEKEALAKEVEELKKQDVKKIQSENAELKFKYTIKSQFPQLTDTQLADIFKLSNGDQTIAINKVKSLGLDKNKRTGHIGVSASGTHETKSPQQQNIDWLAKVIKGK